MANIDYYVRTSGGDNGKDGLSVANGWADLSGTGAVDEGDRVFLCTMNDGESFSTGGALKGGGSTDGSIIWTGANSKGIVDGTFTVIDDDITLPAATNRVVFQYLSLNGGGFNFDGALGSIFAFRCKSYNSTLSAGFITTGNENVVVECYAENSAGVGFTLGTRRPAISCVAINNATKGFDGLSVINCISAHNGTTGFECDHIMNCTAYNNLTGIEFNSAISHVVVNNLLVRNTTALSGTSNGGAYIAKNNAFFANGTDLAGLVNSDLLVTDSITLENDPFISGVNGDFRLNGQAGGRACKHAGIPMVFPNINTTSFVDIGAQFPSARKVFRT